MTDEVFQRIRESVLPSLRQVTLNGYGEPFLARHWDRMFDYCEERDIRIYTTSNGLLLRDVNRVRRLVRSNLILCLSLDGATKPAFESVRPRIKWEWMIEALELIRREAEAAGPDKRFTLRFNFCAMKRNIADLPELICLAHKYGASEVLVLPLAGDENIPELKNESLHDSPEIVSPILKTCYQLATRYNIRFTPSLSFRHLYFLGPDRCRGLTGMMQRVRRRAYLAWLNLQTYGVSNFLKHHTRMMRVRKPKVGACMCMLPWTATSFTADGAVYPCCVMVQPLGNIQNQTWEEIWNGQLYRNLRRTIQSWNPTANCRYCGLPNGMNGGDERLYDKTFARYRKESLAPDDPLLEFPSGFHVLERDPDGRPMHRWMTQQGVIRLPMRRGAKFLRIWIRPTQHTQPPNPGCAVVNGGPVEPFDTTCQDINLPVSHVRDSHIEIRLTMENALHLDPDPRELGMAVRGVDYLF